MTGSGGAGACACGTTPRADTDSAASDRASAALRRDTVRRRTGKDIPQVTTPADAVLTAARHGLTANDEADQPP
jgi:hypothetical protein